MRPIILLSSSETRSFRRKQLKSGDDGDRSIISMPELPVKYSSSSHRLSTLRDALSVTIPTMRSEERVENYDGGADEELRDSSVSIIDSGNRDAHESSIACFNGKDAVKESQSITVDADKTMASIRKEKAGKEQSSKSKRKEQSSKSKVISWKYQPELPPISQSQVVQPTEQFHSIYEHLMAEFSDNFDFTTAVCSDHHRLFSGGFNHAHESYQRLMNSIVVDDENHFQTVQGTPMRFETELNGMLYTLHREVATTSRNIPEEGDDLVIILGDELEKTVCGKEYSPIVLGSKHLSRRTASIEMEALDDMLETIELSYENSLITCGMTDLGGN